MTKIGFRFEEMHDEPEKAEPQEDMFDGIKSLSDEDKKSLIRIFSKIGDGLYKIYHMEVFNLAELLGWIWIIKTIFRFIFKRK